MPSDRTLDAAIAATRFGLGARPGEIQAATADPRGWLAAQIRREGADLPRTDGETSRDRLAQIRQIREARATARAAGDAKAAQEASQAARRALRQKVVADFLARMQLGAQTDAGFRERWALFWANHFTASATKADTAALVSAYEAEAIRPNVFRRFGDLLVAAETHPAMLIYLDQIQSVGPNSPAGQRNRARARGLNENLGREILELHTVGVGGGYTQADVTEFARALTGLSIGGERDPGGEDAVLFRVAAHEPGPRTIMGVRYAEGGRDQAAAVLHDLALKPQTARFVCGKIARHFVADAPPPALTARLEKAWMTSGGDLAQVAEALATAPEAWVATPAKFKTPYEFIVSSYRAAAAAPQASGRVAPVMTAMGQPAFAAPSPKGWPEDAEAWASPDGVVKRMQFAQGFAALAVQGRDPKSLAADALGARLSPATATAVARAESRAEGLALLLMSPEFQRR